MKPIDKHEVIVIGAGQAGLAIGYYLQKHRVDHVILDGAPAVGHSWKTRWDSLKLFTPGWFNGLPGLPFPGPRDAYPGKDDVADYLIQYATHFSLPVRLNTPVTKLSPSDDTFVIETPTRAFEGKQVVIATGPFQKPYIPPVTAYPVIAREAGDVGTEDDRNGQHVHIHSAQYVGPVQLPAGPVLVVGGGNSGAQIAAELAMDRKVFLSVGERLPELPQRFLGRDLFWWLRRTRLLEVTIDSRFGRRMRQTDPLIGSRLRVLNKKYGVEIVSRTQKVQSGRIELEGGRILSDVNNVIWATGFRPDYSWVNMPVFEHNGMPRHRRGVTDIPGLYFLGLPWQYRRGSALLGGVGRDAKFISRRIRRLHRHGHTE